MKPIILLVFILGLFGISCAAIEYEDNDFAEFEVFDEEEDPVDEMPRKEEPGRGGGGGVPEGGGSAKHREDFFEEDEAIVEDDDESDEFSHFHDEDEFIGFDSIPPAPKAKSQGEPKITIANVPLHLRSNWDSFYLEMLMIAGLVLYFVNFFMGKAKNQKLANAWFSHHKSLLESNFTLVGDDGKKGSDNAGGLMKESENCYTLWCSGRVNIESMLIELKFIKRQDMIGVISQLIRPSSDQVLIKVNIDDMDAFVFAYAAKKTASRLVKDMTDIATYCPEKKSPEKFGLSNQFVMMSEIGEVATVILGDQKINSLLTKHEKTIDYIHFSDQYSGPKQPDDGQPLTPPDVRKTLLFGFNIPGRGSATVEGVEGMRPLMQLVVQLVDKIRRFKLSKEAKSKAEKNRARVEEVFLKATHAARAEQAQAKREERKRMERERMMELDDPDKQRKWEEREHRRELKKRTPKMKQVKIAM